MDTSKEQKILYDISVLESETQYIYQPRFTFLPGQSQLQKMVYEDYQMKMNVDFYRFCMDWGGQFNSMEQLWLAFVQKELYNKTWDGTTWKS